MLERFRRKKEKYPRPITPEQQAYFKTEKGRAELEEYFQDPCVGASQSVSHGQRSVPAGTALIHTIILPGRLELLRAVTFPYEWETDRVLLCSDLMHQIGDLEPVTTSDITGRYRHAVETYQQSPVLMDYVPYTENTKRQLANLAALRPRVLAAMHGSTFVGDGAAALVASGEVIRQVTGVSAATV
jgi:hypothetical protein